MPRQEPFHEQVCLSFLLWGWVFLLLAREGSSGSGPSHTRDGLGMPMVTCTGACSHSAKPDWCFALLCPAALRELEVNKGQEWKAAPTFKLNLAPDLTQGTHDFMLRKASVSGRSLDLVSRDDSFTTGPVGLCPSTHAGGEKCSHCSPGGVGKGPCLVSHELSGSWANCITIVTGTSFSKLS